MRPLPLCILALLTACWLAGRPALAQAQAYVPATGPFAVSTLDLTWEDRSRQRVVTTRAYLPGVGADGPRSTVLFSPGLGGSHRHYAYLGEGLARHGHLTLVFDHPGSNDALFAQGGRQALAAAILNRENVVLRAGDVSHVLDRLLAGDHPQAARLGKVDPRRLTMAGHSYGAYAAMLLAGMAIEHGGRRDFTMPDARFRAAIAMGNQGMDDRFFGTHARSWDAIRIPVLTMTGTRDGGSRGQDYTWRNQAFDRLPPGAAYNVVIKDAEHASYHDIPPRFGPPPRPRDPRHWDWIVMTCLAFLDAHVPNAPDALAWLRGKGAERVSGGDMTLRWK